MSIQQARINQHRNFGTLESNAAEHRARAHELIKYVIDGTLPSDPVSGVMLVDIFTKTFGRFGTYQMLLDITTRTDEQLV